MQRLVTHRVDNPLDRSTEIQPPDVLGSRSELLKGPIITPTKKAKETFSSINYLLGFYRPCFVQI